MAGRPAVEQVPPDSAAASGLPGRGDAIHEGSLQGRGGHLNRTKDFGRKRGCLRCGRKRGIVRRYGLHLCRQCFREIAYELGFRKYS
ncbi:MAG: 30S ribosomal protein S14 [Methanobacteriota archaeon]|nr:MAG: 30S ribosomal protein S14 [Euryarchaeota archaeon]TLZ90064.1 MAG: 30S ribosomal protein S14 [Euryarchaeota archaeon]